MKKIIFLSIASLSNLYAGIGAQYNTDDIVKDLTARQKMQEDTLKQSPPASPKSILRKKSQYDALPPEDNWVLELLKCFKN